MGYEVLDNYKINPKNVTVIAFSGGAKKGFQISEQYYDQNPNVKNLDVIFADPAFGGNRNFGLDSFVKEEMTNGKKYVDKVNIHFIYRNYYNREGDIKSKTSKPLTDKSYKFDINFEKTSVHENINTIVISNYYDSISVK
jgi:hypothetical protein